jgi:hypothetical protein
MHQSYAQEELTKEICDKKAEIILKFKNDFENYSPELIDEMIKYITPCADLDNSKTSPKAAYAKGLLHLQKGDFGNVLGHYNELSSLYIYRARAYGYTPAILDDIINDLSNNYLDSDSFYYPQVVKDLNNLLTQGYKTNIVHYLLGYLKLKNLIATSSLYTSSTQALEAKTHFESSNLPMAKHWLAIMHYFGYGTPQDKTKGLQMLADNTIYNSRILKQHLQNQNNDWIPVSAEERIALIENYNSLPHATTVLKDEKTTYEGHFVVFDWLAKGVKRRIPMRLTINPIATLDTYSKHVEYTFSMNGKVSKGQAMISLHTYNHKINFNTYLQRHKLELPALKNLLQDHVQKDTITYSMQSISLKEATINGKLALILKPDFSTKIKEYNESVNAPLRMILYPQTTKASSHTTRSNSTLALDKNFATISPNPIGNEFTITYTLDQAAKVEVAVYDFFGQQKISLPNHTNTARATQTITVDSAALPSGTYIIQMTINGAPYSKTVIKE